MRRNHSRQGKVKTIVVTAVLSAALLLQGCGDAEERTDSSSKRNSKSETAMEDFEGEIQATEDFEEMYVSDMAVSGTNSYRDSVTSDMAVAPSDKGDGAAVTDGRKLIKNVRLEVETQEYEALMPALESQIQHLGGYIDDMETYNGSRYSDSEMVRYANLTVRIPQSELNEFLGSVSELCNVVKRNDSVNDVTMTYVDTASRRDALRTEHTRLLELMEQAESLEEILIIEDRLTSVRYQLESLESQLRTMDNQVDYSTVRIRVSEVKELTPVLEEEEPLGQRMHSELRDTWEEIKEGLADFLVSFVANLPYIVMWVLILGVALLITLRVIKRKRKKKEVE